MAPNPRPPTSPPKVWDGTWVWGRTLLGSVPVLPPPPPLPDPVGSRGSGPVSPSPPPQGSGPVFPVPRHGLRGVLGVRRGVPPHPLRDSLRSRGSGPESPLPHAPGFHGNGLAPPPPAVVTATRRLDATSPRRPRDFRALRRSRLFPPPLPAPPPWRVCGAGLAAPPLPTSDPVRDLRPGGGSGGALKDPPAGSRGGCCLLGGPWRGGGVVSEGPRPGGGLPEGPFGLCDGSWGDPGWGESWCPGGLWGSL